MGKDNLKISKNDDIVVLKKLKKIESNTEECQTSVMQKYNSRSFKMEKC